MNAHRTGDDISFFEYHLTLTYEVLLLLKHCELTYSCGCESLPFVYYVEYSLFQCNAGFHMQPEYEY